MKQFVVKLNTKTGFYEVWDSFYEKVHLTFELEGDAEKECNKLNKKAGY
jgi:hypothetical protein